MKTGRENDVLKADGWGGGEELRERGWERGAEESVCACVR